MAVSNTILGTVCLQLPQLPQLSAQEEENGSALLQLLPLTSLFCMFFPLVLSPVRWEGKLRHRDLGAVASGKDRRKFKGEREMGQEPHDGG